MKIWLLLEEMLLSASEADEAESGIDHSASSAPSGHLSLRASFACKHAPGMFAETAKVLKGKAF